MAYRQGTKSMFEPVYFSRPQSVNDSSITHPSHIVLNTSKDRKLDVTGIGQENVIRKSRDDTYEIWQYNELIFDWNCRVRLWICSHQSGRQLRSTTVANHRTIWLQFAESSLIMCHYISQLDSNPRLLRPKVIAFNVWWTCKVIYQVQANFEPPRRIQYYQPYVYTLQFCHTYL